MTIETLTDPTILATLIGLAIFALCGLAALWRALGRRNAAWHTRDELPPAEAQRLNAERLRAKDGT